MLINEVKVSEEEIELSENEKIILDPTVIRDKRYTESSVTDKYRVDLFKGIVIEKEKNVALEKLFTDMKIKELSEDITQLMFSEKREAIFESQVNIESQQNTFYHIAGITVVMIIIYVILRQIYKLRQNLEREGN
jgi:hypothetical protein